MRVGFTLTGQSSMLMHADNIIEADALEAWRKDPKNKNISRAGDDRSPAWTWQSYLYHDGEHVVIPSDNLMACLRTAGTQLILKKQTTFKAVTQSGMLCESEFLELSTSAGKLSIADIVSIRDLEFYQQAEWAEKHGFRLFAKRAKVGSSKHIRIRPRFDRWTVKGVMIVTAPELIFAVVQKLFELAGNIGLCDWRPSSGKPGPFGMFRSEVVQLGE